MDKMEHIVERDEGVFVATYLMHILLKEPWIVVIPTRQFAAHELEGSSESTREYMRVHESTVLAKTAAYC